MVTHSWVELDTTLSPTKGSTKLHAELLKENPDQINFGQGREKQEPDEEIRPQWQGTSSTAYHVETGGPAASREAMADFVHRYYGVPANTDNTFIIQANGRSALARLLSVMTRRHLDSGASDRPSVWIDDLHWPMYTDVIKNNGQIPVTDLTRQEKFVTRIMNFPNNPLGLAYSTEGLRDFHEDQTCYMHHQPGAVSLNLFDSPYGYADAPNEKGPNFLGPNYEEIVGLGDAPDRLWGFAISFSKSDAMAQPGLTVIVVHPAIAKELGNALSADNGLSYDAGLMNDLPRTFGPDHDGKRLAHYGSLRGKYMTNFQFMQEIGLPLMEDCQPCMTSVLKVHDLIGKYITTDHHGTKPISSVAKLVEAAANVAGVTTVAQHEKLQLVRLANSEDPKNFAEGARRLNEFLQRVRTGPCL